MESLNIPDRLEIEDLNTLKALSDPLRLEILKHVGILNRKQERCTVKQLGEMLGMPPTKLYYHVKMLEEHGLLVVGETKIVSGIIEKHYQVCAMNIGVSQDLMVKDDSGDKEGQLDQILQSVQDLTTNAIQNLNTSLRTIYEEVKLEKEEGIPAREQLAMDVSSFELVLTRDQAKDYIGKITEISKEISRLSDQNLESGNEDALHFGVLSLIVPYYHRTPNPNKTQD